MNLTNKTVHETVSPLYTHGPGVMGALFHGWVMAPVQFDTSLQPFPSCPATCPTIQKSQLVLLAPLVQVAGDLSGVSRSLEWLRKKDVDAERLLAGNPVDDCTW